MWYCEYCNDTFSEPDEERFCYEDEYGVSSEFPDKHYGYYMTCPLCGSEEIVRCSECCEDCGYYNECISEDKEVFDEQTQVYRGQD